MSVVGANVRVLVVEDDAHVRFGICRYLASHGIAVEHVERCDAAIARCMESAPDALILDWRLPDGDAFSVLQGLRQAQAKVPFVLVTAHGSVELAVRAMREGAEDVLTKPVELPTLLSVISRMVGRPAEEPPPSKRTFSGTRAVAAGRSSPFVGTSRAVQQLAEMAARVAETDRPVLILGETGTGKTMLSRWIHLRSARAKEPFVELNCAGLSKELVENELFGHERGAYTGAQLAKTGLVETAHRGTLFLDEVGDLDPSVQPKLLKVLEDRRFRRVGDVRERSVDVRILAATQHDLGQAARDKRFRSDLFYRLSTITLIVPPLSERREDIPLVVRDVLTALGREDLHLTDAAMARVLAYPWPGNVRELKNVIERAVLFATGSSIDVDDVRFDAVEGSREPTPLASSAPMQSLNAVERAHIEAALREEGGHVERAAKRLGIPRSTLYHKLKRLRETGVDLARTKG